MRRAWMITLVMIGCGGGGEQTPAQPALGALIDRIGRPLTATALVEPFADADAHARATTDFKSTSSDPTRFVPKIAAALAIYDGLDGVCGNQRLAAAGAPAPGRYDALAEVFADDRLWVDTARTRCGGFLAVELGDSDDCGGRLPTVDVVDVDYSLLVAGTRDGVTDGIDRDADGTPSTTEFPFLLPPTPGS